MFSTVFRHILLFFLSNVNLAQPSGQSGVSVMNRNYGTESVESTDNSLIELEQRVEEACAMVERVK